MDSLQEKIDEALASADASGTTKSENQVIEGTLDVEGNVTLKKNLKVEGFIDAPKIRGCSKGLYRTREELLINYPHPRIGWWAVVANWENEEVAVGDDEGNAETETVVTYESVLYLVKLDEYQHSYWYNTGKAIGLDGLINQFGDIDNMWTAIREMDEKYTTWLGALDEWVQDAYDEVRATLITSTEGCTGEVQVDGVEVADDKLTIEAEIQSPPIGKETNGKNLEVDVTLDLSGTRKLIKTAQTAAEGAQETADKALTSAKTAQDGVNAINETLEDYPEEKTKWDNVSRQIKSGRVNNGTERFNGMMDSSELNYSSFSDEVATKYEGIVWLRDKKMFVAYTLEGEEVNGTAIIVRYTFYKNWDTAYLYMENVGTEKGLWKDKIYFHAGCVYVWANCDDNLVCAGGNEQSGNFLTFEGIAPVQVEKVPTDYGAHIIVSIPEATGSSAGLMSAEDKKTLDELKQLLEKIEGVTITYKLRVEDFYYTAEGVSEKNTIGYEGGTLVPVLTLKMDKYVNDILISSDDVEPEGVTYTRGGGPDDVTFDTATGYMTWTRNVHGYNRFIDAFVTAKALTPAGELLEADANILNITQEASPTYITVADLSYQTIPAEGGTVTPNVEVAFVEKNDTGAVRFVVTGDCTYKYSVGGAYSDIATMVDETTGEMEVKANDTGQTREFMVAVEATYTRDDVTYTETEIIQVTQDA